MHRTICFLILSMVSAQAGLSTLEAIGMIESGNNDAAVGSAGEISRYQIKPRIWRTFTSLRAYQNQKLSSWVATRYLEVLENSFHKQTGRVPDDFDTYVLWNAGLNYYKGIGFSARRVRPIIRERAQRFVNLRRMQTRTDSEPNAARIATR